MSASFRALLCGALAASSLALPRVASAAEFSLGGYYRLRLELFKSLSGGVGLENVPDERTTGYWQHRVRLDPKIKLNDNVAFFTQIDLLDNTIAGDLPERGVSYQQTGIPEFFSQEMEAQGGPAGDNRRNIAVKRAWGEVTTGVGQLKFGRMGSHWGLGILANEGNGWDDDTGDTVDRIMFITKAGPIYIVPMVDKVSEGPIWSSANNDPVDAETNAGTLHKGSDDVDQLTLVAVYRGELSSAGVYGVYRYQPHTEASAMIGDVWAKTSFGPVRVEVEGVYLTGKILNFTGVGSPVRIEATQWGFAAETEIPLRTLTPGLDFGAASGDDTDAGTINNFTFDRNYRIALLMFRYVGVLGGTVTGSLPGPKAISNASYVRPNVRWELYDNFWLDAAVVYAQTMTKSEANQEGAYGTELDLGVTWRLYEDFEAGFRYGALAPGDALRRPESVGGTADDVDGKLDAVIHGIEGRFVVRF